MDSCTGRIQIYTIPKKPKRRNLPKSRSTQSNPRHSPSQIIERIIPLLHTILCIPQAPDRGPQHPTASTENPGSTNSQPSISSPLTSDTGDRNGTGTDVVVEREVDEGEINGDQSDQATLTDESESIMDRRQEGEGEETVGHIHFCCEQHSVFSFCSSISRTMR